MPQNIQILQLFQLTLIEFLKILIHKKNENLARVIKILQESISTYMFFYEKNEWDIEEVRLEEIKTVFLGIKNQIDAIL